MKKLLLATVSLVAVAAFDGSLRTASSADLIVKARPLVSQDIWTGWYGGLNLGAAIQRNCPGFTAEGVPDPVNDVFLAGLIQNCAKSTGVIGGAQLGFNQQMGRWVWGLEMDFNGLSNKSSRNTLGLSAGGRTINENVTSTTDMLATVRPRVGFLIDPKTLAYVTGGLVMAHVKATGTGSQLAPAAGDQFSTFGSDTRWTPGWTVGGGAEWKLGGAWSLKAEYLYVNLSSVNFDAINQIPANIGGGLDNIVSNVQVPTQLHIFRMGVNYKFGEPSERQNAYASAANYIAHNWTGLYVGANVGGVRGKSHSQEPDAPIDPAAGFWDLTAGAGHVIESKTRGLTGGAQAGFNWQMNALVLGVEGDLGYMRFKGQQVSDTPGYSATVESSIGGAYGMFRGRLGFAFDRALVYGTGGVMVASVGASVDSPLVVTLGDGTMTSTRTGTQTGWVAGGGLEYALMNGWSMKGEYLHFDLGTSRVIGTAINFAPPNTFAFDIRNTGDIVRFGVNKKIF